MVKGMFSHSILLCTKEPLTLRLSIEPVCDWPMQMIGRRWFVFCFV